jgi:hypothetical protein
MHIEPTTYLHLSSTVSTHYRPLGVNHAKKKRVNSKDNVKLFVEYLSILASIHATNSISIPETVVFIHVAGFGYVGFEMLNWWEGIG